MKIHISYSDGRYTYRKVDWGERSVEVPDETVALWDAVFAASDLVEQQLAALANARYEAAEAARNTTRFSLGYSGTAALRGAARLVGAGEAEVAAIGRLDEGTAERVDLDRLAPLAKRAGLAWQQLFPEAKEKPQP